MASVLRAEVPRRRADADRTHAGDLLERVGGAHLQVALRFERQHRVALVDPAVDADLVAFGHDAALLVGIQERGHGRHVEARRHAVPLQDVEDARHAPAVAVLALRQLADRAAAIAQLVGLVIGVERERDRATRAALPAVGLQRAAGPHVIDDRRASATSGHCQGSSVAVPLISCAAPIRRAISCVACRFPRHEARELAGLIRHASQALAYRTAVCTSGSASAARSRRAAAHDLGRRARRQPQRRTS